MEPCTDFFGMFDRPCERCGFAKADHLYNNVASQEPSQDSPPTIWQKFPDVKPDSGQMCIVAAGPDNQAQVVPVRWCAHDQEFYWHDQAQDLGLDPFPTEEANHWTPWPDDPK
jgi:hypothetical protein